MEYWINLWIEKLAEVLLANDEKDEFVFDENDIIQYDDLD